MNINYSKRKGIELVLGRICPDGIPYEDSPYGVFAVDLNNGAVDKLTFGQPTVEEAAEEYVRNLHLLPRGYSFIPRKRKLPVLCAGEAFPGDNTIKPVNRKDLKKFTNEVLKILGKK